MQPNVRGATSALDEDSEPESVGPYQLVRELGRGGMAAVHLARRSGSGSGPQLVALKMIHDELACQREFTDMFMDEARIASQVRHPNVAKVYDFGSADGRLYMTMEYLPGQTVSELLHRAWEHQGDVAAMDALPFLAARVIADACDGLHAAHVACGDDGLPLKIIHRDVSPQNLLITYGGEVKVMDFGCAKARQRLTETSAGIFKGKLAYAAPEQLRIERLDARTDVWALGAVLWELLTLQRVFKRDSPMATAQAVLSEPIERTDALNPYVPRELADIVSRALSRDPTARFPTARALGEALRRFIVEAGATFERAQVADWLDYLLPRNETTGSRAPREESLTARRPMAGPSVAVSPGVARGAGGDEPAFELSITGLRPTFDDAVEEAPFLLQRPREPQERPRSRPLRVRPEDEVSTPDGSAVPWGAILIAVLILTAAIAGAAWVALLP